MEGRRRDQEVAVDENIRPIGFNLLARTTSFAREPVYPFQVGEANSGGSEVVAHSRRELA